LKSRLSDWCQNGIPLAERVLPFPLSRPATMKVLFRQWISGLQRFRVQALALGAGLVLTLVLQNFQFNLFEAYLYDLRMRNKGTASTPNHVAIIKIDDKTVEQLNEFAPLSIEQHVLLLRILGRAKPKAVAYLINFNDSMLADGDDHSNPRVMRAADSFVDLADQLSTNGTQVILGTEIDVTGEVVPAFPLSKLPHRVALLHKDGNTFSEDKVTRRALFSVYDEPVLHTHLAGIISGKTPQTKDFRGVYYMPEVEAHYFYINYSGPTQDDRHGIPEYSAIDVLNGSVAADAFENKVVLIGTKTKDDSNDYVYTPYSRAIFTNSKLVVHANVLETLVNNNAIVKASSLVDFALTFLLTSFIIGLVFYTTPARGVAVTIICAIGVTIFASIAFRFFSVWVRLAHPLLGVFFAYYVFVPYRLIMEYKKRWQFQKKNEVLLQVEELKNNFMGLITHDLKTPVARIQGLAEVLDRNGADHLLTGEIISSTEELNRFITSILELTKIESDRVEFTKTSKDVNRVIKDVIQKFSFSLQTKRIQLQLNLEPLFPIQIDPGLIAKVLSNLIDNAIKYSPVGASIIVSSKESPHLKNCVEISVKDTGYGIEAKDLENLFTKFYRAKNDLTMQTKGSGLGLYLSRYFVEMHAGQLTVDSHPGQGSTFTLTLPIDEKATRPTNVNRRTFFKRNNTKLQKRPRQKGDELYV